MTRRRAAAAIAALLLLAGCAVVEGAPAADRPADPTTTTTTATTGAITSPQVANSTSPTTSPTASPTTTSPTTTPTTAPTSPTTTSPTTTTPTTTTPTTTTPTTTTTTTPTTTTTTTTTTVPITTRCERVAHIGDSTGTELWEAQYVGDATNTIAARYREVGVREVLHDDDGGRSIVERSDATQVNAYEVAAAWDRSGFRGCWVVMIGTNDAANITAGSNVGAEHRIAKMLDVFGDDPVLWIDTASGLADGHYRNESMRAFNAVLERLADARPNVTVLRWSAIVRPEWYRSDGLHFTTEGRIWRAAVTARALVLAFPS